MLQTIGRMRRNIMKWVMSLKSRSRKRQIHYWNTLACCLIKREHLPMITTLFNSS